MAAAKLMSQSLEVFQRTQHAGDSSMVLRARFKLIGQLIRGGTHLVGLQLVKQVILPIQRAGMWTKELFGGTTYSTSLKGDIVGILGLPISCSIPPVCVGLLTFEHQEGENFEE